MTLRKAPKEKPRKRLKLPELSQEVTVKVSTKEEREEEKVQEDVLPIDELVKIAAREGILKEPTEEERWAKFIKGIKLHDIIFDCMQSSFNVYAKAYNEKNPQENIRIRLLISKKHKLDSHVIFGVTCYLQIDRGTKTYKMFEKSIEFTHVKQIRDEETWKYSLYGAVFNDLIAHSINHLMLREDVRSGRVKPE